MHDIVYSPHNNNTTPYPEVFIEKSFFSDGILCHTYESMDHHGHYLCADSVSREVSGKVCEYTKLHFAYTELCLSRQVYWAYRIRLELQLNMFTQYIIPFQKPVRQVSAHWRKREYEKVFGVSRPGCYCLQYWGVLGRKEVLYLLAEKGYNFTLKSAATATPFSFMYDV